jgi:hypothetical protein
MWVLKNGISTAILALVLGFPDPDGIASPQISIVINIAKLSALCGVIYATMRVAKELNRYYQAFYQLLYEHRMVTADLWERRPDKHEDFRNLMGITQPESEAQVKRKK